MPKNNSLNAIVCGKSLEFFLLLLIFTVSLFLRAYKNTQIPPGFYPDEASFANNANSIFFHGEDENGNKLPIFIYTLGNYQGAFFAYLAAPFVGILGKSEFSIRLASGFYGALTVIFLYFWLKLTTKDKVLSLLATTFFSFSFWHIHFSRIGWEIASYPFSLTVSLTIFAASIKKRSSLLFLLSLISFSLTQYSRYNARLEVPLLLLFLLLLYLKELKNLGKKTFFSGVALYLFFSFPFVYAIKHGMYFNRLQQVNNNILKISSSKELIFSLQSIVSAYLYHFSPKFLFIEGDKFLRHTIPGFGLFPQFFIPFFYLGIVLLIKDAYLFVKEKQKRDILRIKILWLFLLLIWPLAPSITFEHMVHRALSGAVIINVICCYSVYSLICYLKLKTSLIKAIVLSLVLSILVILPFIDFWRTYTTTYLESSNAWTGWPFGVKEIVGYFDNYPYSQNFYIDPKISPDINQYLIDFYSKNNPLYKLEDPNVENSKKSLIFATKTSCNQKDKKCFLLETIYPPSSKSNPIYIESFVLEDKKI